MIKVSCKFFFKYYISSYKYILIKIWYGFDPNSNTKYNKEYVIICFILTPFLTLPSPQPLLPSPLKLQNFTTQNGSLMIVCVLSVCRFGISFTYVIEGIDSNLISVVN